MRKGKGDLTKAERLEIGILLEKGYSLRSIARVLGRGKSTISYEIQKNSVNGEYDPVKADHKSYVSKKYRRFEWQKINENDSLREYIITALEAHWNPDEISGRMKLENQPFYASKTAIYEWLRSSRGKEYCKHLYSGRDKVKRRKEKVERVMIPNRVDISKRFKGADNRTRYGHEETDSVVGKKGTPGGLKTMSERKSRFFQAKKVLSMRPSEHAEVVKKMIKDTKTLSLTYDNGIENKDHESVGVPSFFCEPYSSWQKGGVENANKMIRRYFPKKTDFRLVSQEMVDEVVLIINNDLLPGLCPGFPVVGMRISEQS